MRAFVVGGTGPTGVPIVNGLLARGLDVTVFHTGRHESPDLLPVRHVHGDPTDREAIERAFGRGDVELALVLYGRARLVAEVAALRCVRFMSISGLPVYAGYLTGSGARLPIPIPEDAPLVALDVTGLPYPAGMVRKTEDEIFGLAASGAFDATILRYPVVYGRRVYQNFEWITIRRVLAGDRTVVLPDGGAAVHSRVAVDNAAACVLAAVDRPHAAANRAFNVADVDQYTLREWVEATARFAGRELEVVAPDGTPVDDYTGLGPGSLALHALVDTSRAAVELGHRDVIAPLDALADAVEWALAHPQPPGSLTHILT